MTIREMERVRRDEIFAMIEQGKPRKEVARAANCTISNISKLIRVYRPELRCVTQKRGIKNWGGCSVAKLQPDHVEFIKKEAKASGVSPAEMARALLVDAIFDAMEKRALAS